MRDGCDERPLRPRQAAPLDALIETLSQMAGNHYQLQGQRSLSIIFLCYVQPRLFVRSTLPRVAIILGKTGLRQYFRGAGLRAAPDDHTRLPALILQGIHSSVRDAVPAPV